MRTKLLSCFVLIVFCATIANAQEKDIVTGEKELNHYIGIGAGFTSGFGLSYRMSYGKFGAQLNFAPISHSEYYSLFSTGILARYRVSESNITNLYVYAASHYLVIENHGSKNDYFNNGIGFNFEFNSTKKIIFNWKFGVGAYDYFNRFSLTAEAGIHYRL